ncbi:MULTISPECIES: hypothetical protein [Actinosynnema]|uniref:Uncharacterized protein n=1 Tax=Actinosynnema pretiosum TaxID=42197 RepID=A0A290Z0T1_9PSEU|nr:hypothetical protein [Actinosynnema pretiosum]ATE52641.1 hypothetical protein CNX65_04530 [Actinosynnema pretiosum]
MNREQTSHHRKKGGAALKTTFAALGVLVLLGVVQAATAGTVGVGALSVDLRGSATPTTSAPAGAPEPLLPPSTPAEPAPDAETKVVEGSWKQARGLLTAEITKVETVDGRIRLHLTAVNASTAKMDIPLTSITARDDAGAEYAATPTSRWSGALAKGATTTGQIDLDDPRPATATTLTVTLSDIVGSLAPTGGAITVQNVPLP